MEPFKPNHDHDKEEYQHRMDRIVAVLAEFAKETDRGLAVLAAAMLEEKLRIILSNFLVQGKPIDRLFNGPNAPMGTFSAKLDMAYAVGLISADEHHDAEIIRKIRNDFAHKFELEFSFNNSSVSDRCNNISTSKRMVGEYMEQTGLIANARTIFQVSVGFLDYSWMFREEHAKHLRLQAPDWRKHLFPTEIL